jgi:hypothetical protein
MQHIATQFAVAFCHTHCTWPQEAQKRHQELERRKTEIKQLEAAGQFDVNF